MNARTAPSSVTFKALLADDHPLIREGVRHVVARLAPRTIILDAHDYPSLFAQAALHTDLDLALVDLNMPGFVGIQGIAQFRSRFPDIPLVVLSASEAPQDVRQVIGAGALGYIPKSSSTEIMLRALRQVLAGYVFIPRFGSDAEVTAAAPGAQIPGLQHAGLTARQFEVARLLARGCPNKTIAELLALSESTVKIHVAAIFRALGVNNRAEAVLAMQRRTQG
jgi:DNA-binding NarL/FixJ family response regulator